MSRGGPNNTYISDVIHEPGGCRRCSLGPQLWQTCSEGFQALGFKGCHSFWPGKKVNQRLGDLRILRRSAGGRSKADIVAEFTRERAENFDTMNRHYFTEQRDYQRRLTCRDALRGRSGPLCQDNFGLDIRGDAQAFKHFLDISSACSILRI